MGTEDKKRIAIGVAAIVLASCLMPFADDTTPLIPMKKLEAMGVARVSLPRMLPAAAIAGMRMALKLMTGSIESGEIIEPLRDRIIGRSTLEKIIDPQRKAHA